MGLHKHLDYCVGQSAHALQAQPYVQHDVNAGPTGDIAHLNSECDTTASSGQASDRSAHAAAMGPRNFASLLHAIEQAHEKVRWLLCCNTLHMPCNLPHSTNALVARVRCTCQRGKYRFVQIQNTCSHCHHQNVKLIFSQTMSDPSH